MITMMIIIAMMILFIGNTIIVVVTIIYIYMYIYTIIVVVTNLCIGTFQFPFFSVLTALVVVDYEL